MCRLLVLIVAILSPPLSYTQLYTIPNCVIASNVSDQNFYGCTAGDEINGVMYVTEYPPSSGCYFSIALRTYQCIPTATINGYYFDRICLIMRCDGTPEACFSLDVHDLVCHVAIELVSRDPLQLWRISDTVRVSYPTCWRESIIDGCYEGRTCVEAYTYCCTDIWATPYQKVGSVGGDSECPQQDPFPQCSIKVCRCHEE